MIAIDTSLLVRFVTGDIPEQELARELVVERCDAKNPACVSLPVALKLYFFLARI
ncbi:MAG: hypothetical protein ACFBZ8_07355 [Opitutales bacterium]